MIPLKKIKEESAQKVIDRFYSNGALVRKDEWDLILASQDNIIKSVIEYLEEMHKCWCGGGKHFAKSRVVVHTSECALNNQGYYDAINKAINHLREQLG